LKVELLRNERHATDPRVATAVNTTFDLRAMLFKLTITITKTGNNYKTIFITLTRNTNTEAKDFTGTTKAATIKTLQTSTFSHRLSS